MRIIAVLDVDEKKLSQTGHSFEEEMGWAAPSGITLSSYTDAGKCSTYEYAAFAWNTEKEEYAQTGRAVMTEQLCRNRFKERVEKGWRHVMTLKRLCSKDAAYQSYMAVGRIWSKGNRLLCRQLRTMEITKQKTCTYSIKTSHTPQH